MINVVLVLFPPCFSQTVDAAACTLLAHSSRPIWRSRSSWAKASGSKNQVEGGSGLLGGCLERAWTDSISVSQPATCPRFCDCKSDVL